MRAKALSKEARGWCKYCGLPNGFKGNSAIDFAKFLQEHNQSAFAYTGEIAESGGFTLGLFWLARWANCGLPVFRLTESCLAGLALTDPSSVAMDDFRPPFDAFLIELPSNFWSKNGAQVESILVSHDIEVFTQDDYTKRQQDTIIVVHCDNNDILHSALILGKKTVGEVEADHVGTLADIDIDVVSEPDRLLLQNARRVFYNLCLYVAESGNGKRIGRVNRDTDKCSSKIQKPKIWVLETKVKFGPEIINAAKASLSHTKGWRVQVRHAVRGHWRNQVCGPRNTERRRTWIQPHWKGPEGGTKISHVYVPSETQEG